MKPRFKTSTFVFTGLGILSFLRLVFLYFSGHGASSFYFLLGLVFCSIGWQLHLNAAYLNNGKKRSRKGWLLASFFFLTLIGSFTYTLDKSRKENVAFQERVTKWKAMAKGKILEQRIEPSTRLVNGEMDAGIVVNLKIKNEGDYGTINIGSDLSCSEGEWHRKQTLYFKGQETMDLEFFFQEPSINATNVQNINWTDPGVN